MIGLSSQQLGTVFIQRLQANRELWKAHMQAESHGEGVQMLSSLISDVPGLSREAQETLFGILIPFLSALTETIEANNRIIAAAVPHLENLP